MKPKFRKVNKDEFKSFVSGYPRKIVRDYNNVSEPPMTSYDDYKLGAWPACTIAKQLHKSFWGQSDEYYIKDGIEC